MLVLVFDVGCDGGDSGVKTSHLVLLLFFIISVISNLL